MVLAVPLCVTAAGEAAASPAAATDKTPVIINPRVLRGCDNPAGTGFWIQTGVVENKEKSTITTLADGTTVEKITGKLVLSFTNIGPNGTTTGGKSIVKNVSGPTTTTTYPKGTVLFEGTGNNWLGFGPNGQRNTGEPGLVFTSGKVTVTIDAATGTALTFSLNGHQENGCDLLK